MTGAPETIVVPSVIGGEIDVVERVAAIARSLGFGPMKVDDISTSLREACVNAVEHGLRSIGTYEVNISYDASELTIAVSSKGKGISLKNGAPTMASKVEGNDSPRGWGLFLIQKLADSFKIESHNGVNIVHMTFSLNRM